MAKQTSLYRGIYEFEDPSGVVLGAKVPATGTADLYSGTAVIVKPSQCAIFVYEGKIADVLFSGTHTIETGNVPLLTKLANWKFGFESPLRAELIFVSGHEFTGRRWGTPQPVIAQIGALGAVALRSFGTFSLVVADPARFFLKLMGTRALYAISDLEEFVQAQIIELLPQVFSDVKSLDQLGSKYSEFSAKLQSLLDESLKSYGISVERIQIQSVLPGKEVMDALEAKNAMQLIGSQKQYLVYKAANSLGANEDSAGNNSLHMLMSLMLSKGLIANEIDKPQEGRAIAQPVSANQQRTCPACRSQVDSGARFCPQCGGKLT